MWSWEALSHAKKQRRCPVIMCPAPGEYRKVFHGWVMQSGVHRGNIMQLCGTCISGAGKQTESDELSYRLGDSMVKAVFVLVLLQDE